MLAAADPCGHRHDRPGYDDDMSRWEAWARATHPIPSAAVAAIVVMLAAGIGQDVGILAVIAVTVFANQVSVGLSNDWLDADRDREVGRTDKPVALGILSRRSVRTVAMVSAAVSIAASLPLGAAALANLVFLAAGWAYNAGLKSTVFSAVPYAVGFGTIPLIATLALPQPMLASGWAVLAGALLGVSAHFANVLPDLDDDRRTGVHGLPHRLGRRTVGFVIAVSLAGASASIVLGPGAAPPAQLIALGVSVLLALACSLLVALRPASRAIFWLTIVGAVVNVALLALSGERLLA